MDELKIGTRVHVLAVSELNDKNGRRIARYLPDFSYRVTPVNMEHLRAEIAAGRMRVDGASNGAGVRPTAVEGKVKGGVTVIPKKGK